MENIDEFQITMNEALRKAMHQLADQYKKDGQVTSILPHGIPLYILILSLSYNTELVTSLPFNEHKLFIYEVSHLYYPSIVFSAPDIIKVISHLTISRTIYNEFSNKIVWCASQ